MSDYMAIGTIVGYGVIMLALGFMFGYDAGYRKRGQKYEAVSSKDNKQVKER